MPRLKGFIRLSVLLAVFVPLLGANVFAQEADPINQTDDPILREFVWRSIGPSKQSVERGSPSASSACLNAARAAAEMS